MRNHLKRSVQHTHLEAVPDRTTPQQPRWHGPRPPGVDAILGRDALDKPYDGFFAEWASNLALLNCQFVEHIYQGDVARIRNQFATSQWVLYKVYDLAQCDVGEHQLWIKKQLAGWSVELRYPSDVDARVLTIEKMPVLCPEVDLARKLALACYPNEVAGLIWHPIS